MLRVILGNTLFNSLLQYKFNSIKILIYSLIPFFFFLLIKAPLFFSFRLMAFFKTKQARPPNEFGSLVVPLHKPLQKLKQRKKWRKNRRFKWRKWWWALRKKKEKTTCL